MHYCSFLGDRTFHSTYTGAWLTALRLFAWLDPAFMEREIPEFAGPKRSTLGHAPEEVHRTRADLRHHCREIGPNLFADTNMNTTSKEGVLRRLCLVAH